MCPIAEGDRVQAEVVTVLLEDQREYIRSAGLWPSAFDECDKSAAAGPNGRRGAQLVDAREQVPADMLPPSDSDSDTDSNSERDVDQDAADEARSNYDIGAKNDLQPTAGQIISAQIHVDK